MHYNDGDLHLKELTMPTQAPPDLSKLSVNERIELIEQIWDSILPDQDELDGVAAARGHDGVDAHADPVRAEDPRPRHADTGIRRGDDVAPGGRPDRDAKQVEPDADPERRPPYRRQVVEERVRGVDDGLHATQRVTLGRWRRAPSSATSAG